jgi:hypothetical protein
MNTIVSAFISNINQQKSISQFIDYGKRLLSPDVSNLKIIFIERNIYNEYFYIENIQSIENICNKYIFKYELKEYKYIIQENIIFVFFEKQDNYFYNYIDEITNFNVNTDNPTKDTLEYMFIQSHKTEWMKMAIQLMSHIKNDNVMKIDVQECSNFIWVDFGIYHIFHNNVDEFNNEFKKLNQKNLTLPDKIRIGSCIHPSNTYHTDIYRNITWYFAGGVFGGESKVLVKFADLMKKECIRIIKERKHLMWEVNIWYLLYLKQPRMFEPYLCDHNSSIVAKY